MRHSLTQNKLKVVNVGLVGLDYETILSVKPHCYLKRNRYAIYKEEKGTVRFKAD